MTAQGEAPSSFPPGEFRAAGWTNVFILAKILKIPKLQPAWPLLSAYSISKPRCLATVKMSLSPRPHMFMIMI